jgi:hypothetical protein
MFFKTEICKFGFRLNNRLRLERVGCAVCVKINLSTKGIVRLGEPCSILKTSGVSFLLARMSNFPECRFVAIGLDRLYRGAGGVCSLRLDELRASGNLLFLDEASTMPPDR